MCNDDVEDVDAHKQEKQTAGDEMHKEPATEEKPTEQNPPAQ